MTPIKLNGIDLTGRVNKVRVTLGVFDGDIVVTTLVSDIFIEPMAEHVVMKIGDKASQVAITSCENINEYEYETITYMHGHDADLLQEAIK